MYRIYLVHPRVARVCVGFFDEDGQEREVHALQAQYVRLGEEVERLSADRKSVV